MREGRSTFRSGHDDAVSTLVSLLVAAAVFASVFSVAFVLAGKEQSALADSVAWNSAADEILSLLTETPGDSPTWTTCAGASRIGLLAVDKPVRLISPVKFDALRGTQPAAACASFDVFKEKTGITAVTAGGTSLPFDPRSMHARVRVEPAYFPFANGTTAELTGVRTAYIGQWTGTTAAGQYASVNRVEAGLLKESGLAFVNSTNGVYRTLPPNSYPARSYGDVFNDSADDLGRKLSLRLAGFDGTWNSTESIGSEPSGWKVIEKGFYGTAVCQGASDKCHRWWTTKNNGCNNDNTQVPRRLLTVGTMRTSGGCRFEYDARTYELTIGEFDLRAYDSIKYTAYAETTGWFAPTRALVTLTATQAGIDKAQLWAVCLANCTATEAQGVPQKVWEAAGTYGTKPGQTAPPGPGPITNVTSLDKNDAPTDYKFTGKKTLLYLRLDGRGAVANVIPACNPGGALCTTENGQGWFLSRVKLRVDRVATGAQTVIYDNQLDYKTTKYDILVVGSDARQADALMASRQIDVVPRAAVLSWVQAGGRLVALGTSVVNNEWLATAPIDTEAATPTFTVASGAAQAVSGLREDASDVSHPIVTSPHVLGHVLSPRAPGYAVDNNVPYAPSNVMTKVLVGEVAGCSGATCPSLLAVSNPSSAAVSRGHDGFVVLTSMRPGLMGLDPSRQDADPEAWRTLVDLLAYASRHDANLDWGESVPKSAPFGHASTTSALPRNGDGDPWPVTVTTFVWD